CQQVTIVATPAATPFAVRIGQTALLPRRLCVGVRYVFRVLIKLSKFLAAALCNCRGELWIAEASEIKEWRVCAQFFTHKDERNERTQKLKRHGCFERARRVATKNRQPLSKGPIAYLIMVLKKNHK